MRWLAAFPLALGVMLLAAPCAGAGETKAARDVQRAVDAYVASARADANLVGRAGHDGGFWLRAGDPWLRLNLTIQARYEWFDLDKTHEGVPPEPDSDLLTHDLSGFSVPRTTLKLSGEAPCRVRYYAELEFGHAGGGSALPFQPIRLTDVLILPWPVQPQANALDPLREAWIEWGPSAALRLRLGLVKTPGTRQLMVPPELQQFADVSMAAAVTGILLPGYTDRNRDCGLLLGGRLGCAGEFQYLLAATNGDGGDAIRSVLDHETSDGLAWSGRLNWAFLRPIGYAEGGSSRPMGTWHGEVGAWAYTYADRADRDALFGGNDGTIADRLLVGGDVAFVCGGWSFTGAFTYVELTGSEVPGVDDEEWLIWLLQSGYRFPGSGWELAARWSAYRRTVRGAAAGGLDAVPETNTLGIAINYYLRGHQNKIQFDATYVGASRSDPIGAGYADAYSGVPLGWGADGGNVYARLQWQLAL